MFFKGAGPGTHWWSTDARLSGFTASATRPANVASMISHIIYASHPSPYMSLSASFAFARSYALVGPSGVATPTAPGYVYEIDPTIATAQWVDPVREIVGALGKLSVKTPIGLGPLHHDGTPELLHALLSPVNPAFASYLTTAPPRRPGGVVPVGPPKYSNELECLVRALRDAEMLVEGILPAACVVARHDVVP